MKGSSFNVTAGKVLVLLVLLPLLGDRTESGGLSTAILA